MLIAWLEAAVLNYYSEVRVQGRSVGVTTDNGFCLDVVPGTRASVVGDMLWIPDRDAKAWVSSDPKQQIAFATARNAATSGYYVQTVKILKHWRDRLATESARVKSYILESLVARSLTSAPASHAAAVLSVFEGVWNQCQAWIGTGKVPPVPDPGNSAVSVSKRWRPAEFDAFLSAIKSAKVIARNAKDEADLEKSAALWRQLFGREFGAI